MTKLPLAVDLDGTLCRTDTLWEMFIRLIRRKPWLLFYLPVVWIQKGRPAFKAAVAQRQPITTADIPINQEFLDFLQKEKVSGREIVLATAADREFARRLVEPLAIFDDVLGSTQEVNLKSAAKAEALCQRYGEKGFVYAGNEKADVAVWNRSGKAIAVTLGKQLRLKLGNRFDWEAEFPPPSNPNMSWWQALRPDLWSLNALLVIPWLVSGAPLNCSILWTLLLGIVLLSFASGALSILQELFSIDFDRQHDKKRERPFAAGHVHLEQGLLLAPILLITTSLLSALAIPSFGFTVWLLVIVAIGLLLCYVPRKLHGISLILLFLFYLARIPAGDELVGVSLFCSFF